jgi:hypothetical protein
LPPCHWIDNAFAIVDVCNAPKLAREAQEVAPQTNSAAAVVAAAAQQMISSIPIDIFGLLVGCMVPVAFVYKFVAISAILAQL